VFHKKEAAKVEIEKLIADFEKKREYYEKTDEANIETKLVELLFAALGWTKDDFEKREKVKRKDRRGITDYMFKLRGKSVFVLEAKKVEVDIELDEKTWKQAISYTLSKQVRFSVLTNFESLLIFCTDDEKAMSPFRKLRYKEYLTRFEDLWLLSKDSFEQNLIFDRATSEGRMKKRRTIDAALLEDLISSRKKIVESIERNYSGKYTTLEKDDIAQRIFGRLIFIRKCEDKQINFDKDDKEIEMLKEVTTLPHSKAYPQLKKIFTKYDDVFNSGLFAKDVDSDVDKIEIDGKVIKELIESTYESKDKNYIYNFEWIDADVLGNIYEQYLGHILKETTKQTKIKESHAHRREQGIYYTPTDIVEYIVNNTLGEMLKKKKPEEVKNLRILDPACGSGSFLIKAFDILEDYYEKNIMEKQLKFDSSSDFYSIKTQMLTNNIFGVDLDHKAVEIAQLNLFLKLAERGHSLPLLHENIQNGNSLIDDDTIAGDKAFKWQERFSSIIQFDKKDQLKDGYGFDVIIGNPPYGVQFVEKEREYFKIKYPHRDKDINSFVLFVERAIGLIKKDGYLGLIIPKNFIKTDDYEKIRNLVLRNTSLYVVADFGKKFEEVTGEMVVIILKKKVDEKNNTRIEIYDEDLNVTTTHVEQAKFLAFDKSRINLTSSTKTSDLAEKVRENSIRIEGFLEIIRGVETGKKDNYISLERQSHSVPIVAGKDVDRYIVKSIRYMKYLPDKINFKDESVYKNPKILIRKIASHIHATYDTSGIYTTQGVYCLYGKSERELKGVLGIINSKLLRWYYDFYFNMGSHLTTNVTIENVRNLYVKEKVPNEMITLVDRILSLNKKLSEFGDKKTDQRQRIDEDIKKTDAEIDELVYKLYGITEKEKRIIEGSLR